MILVAEQSVKPGTSRKVAIHIRIIGHEPIRDPSGSDFAFRVEDCLIVILVDVPPPGLRVANEGGPGKFLQGFVESLETRVIPAMLEV